MAHLRRALDRLSIDLIGANSPQAKGRVERVNATLQDRFVKAMRLHRIDTIDQANAFLPSYMAQHNQRFEGTVRPTRSSSASLASRARSGMPSQLADDVDYQLLRNIPGIGPINALTILAEADDLRRFNHHRQFLKFYGLDLATCQSSTFRGRTRLSKYGYARLRRTFWMAAQVAARQRDNSFRDKLGPALAAASQRTAVASPIR